MTGTLRNLKERETAALHQFSEHLIDELGERVLGITLFGSKVRGDYTADSDLDLLVVLNDGGWDTKDQVRFIAADVSLEYDVLINTHIVSRQRWEELAHHKATLWREVREDGVSLMPQQASQE